jgi:hypothetical protein
MQTTLSELILRTSDSGVHNRPLNSGSNRTFIGDDLFKRDSFGTLYEPNL